MALWSGDHPDRPERSGAQRGRVAEDGEAYGHPDQRRQHHGDGLRQPRQQHGAAAISAAKAALRQVKTVWPRRTYSSIGITPMIGQNDTAGEVLTPAQAKHLVSWEKASKVGRLSFWSLNRDQQCAGSPGGAQDGCSGTTESARQFTRILLGLTGPRTG